MNNGNTYVTHNKVRDVLDELAEHNKSVFTLNDAARIMNKPKKYVSKLLAMSRKVARIERGKYFITTGKNIDFYEIASQIVFPSYISLFAASFRVNTDLLCSASSSSTSRTLLWVTYVLPLFIDIKYL